MLWKVQCLQCGNVTAIDIGPMSWASCPQCGADRVHLRKLAPYGAPLPPRQTDPFQEAMRRQ